MKALLFSFAALFVLFGAVSCKKPATHYCYDYTTDTTGAIIVIESTRTSERFENNGAAMAFQTNNNKACYQIP